VPAKWYQPSQWRQLRRGTQGRAYTPRSSWMLKYLFEDVFIEFGISIRKQLNLPSPSFPL